MNITKASSVFILACVLMTSGCATYRQHVADDFRDAVKLNAGVGVGLYAHVKATSFLDAGVGWGGIWINAGLEDRYSDVVHPSMTSALFPLGVIPGLIPDESPWTGLRMATIRLTNRSDVDGDYTVPGELFDWQAMTKWDAYGIQKRSPHQVLKNDDPTYTEQPLGFEAGVGAGIVNVSVGFDPVEFCDLLCTLCGRELLHDKGAPPLRQRQQPLVTHLPARRKSRGVPGSAVPAGGHHRDG